MISAPTPTVAARKPDIPSTAWVLEFIQDNAAILCNLRSVYLINATCNRGYAAVSRAFSALFQAASTSILSLTLDRSTDHYQQAVAPNPFYPLSEVPQQKQLSLVQLDIQSHQMSLETLQVLCSNLENLRYLHLHVNCFERGKERATISPNIFEPLTKLIKLRLYFGQGLAIASRAREILLPAPSEFLFSFTRLQIHRLQH